MIALAPRTVRNIPEGLRTDDGLAAGFHHAGADEQVLAAERGVAHTCGAPLEVIRLSANLFEYFGVGGSKGAQRSNQLFDFPLVEQPFLVQLHPGFLSPFVVGVESPRQVPQALAGVIEIDDLQRAGKVLLRKIPDPSAPSPTTTFFAARVQPRFQASR